MLARSHVGWGLAASLLLHVTGIAALTLALPRLNVRPGVIRRVELAIVQEPPPAASSKPAPPPPAAVEVSLEPAAGPAATRAAPGPDDRPSVPAELAAADAPRVPVTPSATSPTPSPQPKLRKAPKAVLVPKVQSSVRPDPRSDGSALERVLRQIAATSELTQDERRRAMLVVLRTWEDPAGKRSADELIEALLKNVRAARTASPAESPTH
jgi:hypothetical protein